jgi:hypothetical protein
LPLSVTWKVDWYSFVGGKQDVNSSTQKVMPAFGDNKNVTCYMDDLYVGLRPRRTREGQREAGRQEKGPRHQPPRHSFSCLRNKNVTCYMDDLYVYLKARAAGAMGRIRPNEKEDRCRRTPRRRDTSASP